MFLGCKMVLLYSIMYQMQNKENHKALQPRGFTSCSWVKEKEPFVYHLDSPQCLYPVILTLDHFKLLVIKKQNKKKPLCGTKIY